jgi:SSS family solute:Na+ symporter
MSNLNFHLLDWIVIAGYIFLIFYLAIKASNSEKLTNNQLSYAEDKYLAGKSLTFTEAICSIIATEVSALTFLGIPAFAFKSDFSFIQIYFGAIIGRFVIATIFIPKIYDQGLTVYEIMGKNSPKKSGKKTVAIFYTIAKILSVGVRLFSGSILIAQFFNVNLYIGLALVTIITFFYTLIGGLKAVVRTDVFQMMVFIFGGIIAHVMIPLHSGNSWFSLINMAHIAGKTSFFNLNNPLPFLFGIMGGIVFDMATHGVDQDFAQRLIASKDIKTAKRAIFLSSFLSISVGLLFLGVGALLWSYYQIHQFPSSVQGADHLFAYFIVNHFPVGIRGLMVAGVLAATMSTLDSTINAISATLYNDVFGQESDSDFKSNSLIINIVSTILLFLVAVITAQSDGLLLLGLKIQSWTAGSLLGLFISTVLAKRLFNYKFDFLSVVGAYLFGTFGVYINSFVLKWDWNLNVYWGCILSLIFLKIYSSLRPQSVK